MKFKIVSQGLPRPVEIESEATTWGEFKKDLQKNGISTDNIIGGVRSTKHTLEIDDAVIPHSNSGEVIFIYANTMKSGGPKSGETREEYNARRRKEYAEAKKGTPVAKKATTHTPAKEVEKLVDANVAEIISALRNVTSQLTTACEELPRIEEAIKSLPANTDDAEMLRTEYNNLRAQLAKIHSWK